MEIRKSALRSPWGVGYGTSMIAPMEVDLARNAPPAPSLDRRRLLQGSAVLGGLSALGLGGCATTAAPLGVTATAPPPPGVDPRPFLTPLRASMDRIFDTTVCLRPFRAAGPRL